MSAPGPADNASTANVNQILDQMHEAAYGRPRTSPTASPDGEPAASGEPSSQILDQMHEAAFGRPRPVRKDTSS